MSDDLVAFLRARYDDTAREARETAEEFGAVWTADVEMECVRSDTGADVVDEPNTPLAHIVRHDPARVLREVEAKRALLKRHAPRERGDGCVVCDDGNDSCGCLSGPHWSYPCDTVKILALPYVDHPEYREEWRP